MHLPTPEDIFAWPDFSPNHPLKILASACLSGALCGFDGTSYGEYPTIKKLLNLPNVKPVLFCPEDFSFGTPREVCNIYGGNGFDVLDGKAKALTDSGEDRSAPMILAAQRMLDIADENHIHLAVLMDISAACGSQVIYDGPRDLSNYRQGQGVCTALLMRHGYRVISQRDFRTLEYIFQKLDPVHNMDSTAVNHHETEWFRKYFPG